MNRLILPLLATAGVGLAQQNSIPKVKSPDVQSDGRVIFNYYDPKAQVVTVSLEGASSPFTMTKGPQGVWTFTTQVLAPDLYGYSLQSDGAHRLDPANVEIKPNLLGLSNVVHVPGSSPLPWEESDIAHGTIHHHFYRSAVVGDNRDYYVYTPPGYDASTSATYPVLYLLHGYSDDASGWTAVGKANLILDTLLAEHKIKPMIVVMPLGYGTLEILHPTGTGSPFQNAALREKNFVNFRSALIDEVIPAVERAYKVDTRRDSRAIAGLSMGGAESLLTGLNRTDLFSWVGAFSSGGLGADYSAAFPQISSSLNNQLHLLWIACGTDDRLITPNRELVTWLKSKDIHLTQVETPGMHTWMVWRRNLISFAPLLFGNTSTRASSMPAK